MPHMLSAYAINVGTSSVKYEMNNTRLLLDAFSTFKSSVRCEKIDLNRIRGHPKLKLCVLTS